MDNVVGRALSNLGFRGTDRVAGFEGVITSVTFDVYGCVQYLLTPPVKDGKVGESYWFDVKRIRVGAERVMEPPPFAEIEFGKEPGGNSLPTPSSMPTP